MKKIFIKYNWYYYWSRYMFRKKNPNLSKNLKFSKHDFLDAEDCNLYVGEVIQQNKPSMFCRIGASESFVMRTFEFMNKKNYNKALEQLCLYSGFFPCEEEMAYKFVEIMKKSIKLADLCGTLMCPLDDYFINKNLDKEAKVTILDHIDPIGKSNSWTKVLRGKKVLVVHPFSKTIEKQYEKRKLIFPDYEYLPEFELIVYKAVQTSAGQKDTRFNSWFEALEFMSKEIATIDFDIALLGCGAYGLPLAAEIKSMGRRAIQIGGSLQLLFGIRGGRWDDDPGVAKLYNAAWVYPDESETPKGAKDVENSCYWK